MRDLDFDSACYMNVSGSVLSHLSDVWRAARRFRGFVRHGLNSFEQVSFQDEFVMSQADDADALED